jgi:sporulation protein YlmC with PRC-barrel domain
MVEIRRQSDVTSSDGRYVGHVVGLVFGDQQRIVELVIHHGHLWGKREIAIPIDAIERLMSDGIVLRWSHEEVTR